MRRKEIEEKLWHIVEMLKEAEQEGDNGGTNDRSFFKFLREKAQEVHFAIKGPDYELPKTTLKSQVDKAIDDMADVMGSLIVYGNDNDEDHEERKV